MRKCFVRTYIGIGLTKTGETIEIIPTLISFFNTRHASGIHVVNEDGSGSTLWDRYGSLMGICTHRNDRFNTPIFAPIKGYDKSLITKNWKSVDFYKLDSNPTLNYLNCDLPYYSVFKEDKKKPYIVWPVLFRIFSQISSNSQKARDASKSVSVEVQNKPKTTSTETDSQSFLAFCLPKTFVKKIRTEPNNTFFSEV